MVGANELLLLLNTLREMREILVGIAMLPWLMFIMTAWYVFGCIENFREEVRKSKIFWGIMLLIVQFILIIVEMFFFAGPLRPLIQFVLS